MNQLVKSNEFDKQLENIGLDNSQIYQISRLLDERREEEKRRDENFMLEIKKIVKENERSNQMNDKKFTVIEGQYNQLKNDEVTDASRKSLNRAIEKRAEEIISKNGIQISIESYFDPKTMTASEKVKMDKKFADQYKSDRGKVISAIKVSLKKFLGMKGNAPDATFKQVDMDLAHEYVRKLKSKDVL